MVLLASDSFLAWRLRAVAVALTLAAASPACLAQYLEFSGPLIFQFSTLVRSSAVGDIDGDGRNDLAVASGLTYIYLQQSDGSFVLSDAPGGNSPYWVELADLNDDDDLDLIVGDKIGVRVRFGSGDGTFGSPNTTLDFSDNPVRNLSCLDLDGDGDIDVAATARDLLSIFLNDGEGELDLTQSLPLPDNPLTFQDAGDLDQDGDPDIITVAVGGEVTVHVNDGEASFNSILLLDVADDEVLDGVAIADLDGDGDNDVATTSLFNWDGHQFWGTLRLLENHGSLGDWSYTEYDYPDMMIHLDAADMTGDGLPELVWTDFLGECAVLEHFEVEGIEYDYPFWLPAAGPWSVRIAKINDDDLPDIAVSSYGDRLLVYFNGSDLDVPDSPPVPPPPPPLPPEGFDVAGDLFDDGMAAPLWGGIESDPSSLSFQEDDDRLEFSGGESSTSALAGYVSRRWNLNWADGFKVRAAWHNELEASPQGQTGACLAVTFEAEPDEDPLDNAIIVRSGVNSAGRFASYQVVLNGVELAQQSQQIQATDGHLIIEYVALTDSLMLFAGGSDQPEPWIVESLEDLGISDIALSSVYVGGFKDNAPLAFDGDALRLDTVVVPHGYLPPDVPWFTEEQDYNDGAGARAVALGDLNGDGWDDMVSAAAGDDIVSVRFNTQSAGADDADLFGDDASYPVQQHPLALSLADLDDDGDLDVAALNRDSKTVSLLENDGSGGLSLAANLTMGKMPVALLASDLNGDGAIDLAAVNRDQATVSIRFNLAQGNALGATFGPRIAYPTGEKPVALDAADLDGDGWNDIITAHQPIKKVSLLWNLGGSFDLPQQLGMGTRAFAVRAADLNHDGLIDLAVAGRGPDAIAWRMNNGDGTFAPRQLISSGGKPTAIIAGDFDGAGHADLAFLNQAWNQLTIMRNLGDATMALPEPFDTGGGPVALAAADLDHDGDLDLAVADKASGRITVHINRRSD